MLVARDYYGLALYNVKPQLDEKDKIVFSDMGMGHLLLNDNIFPQIIFENSPIEVELKIRKK